MLQLCHVEIVSLPLGAVTETQQQTPADLWSPHLPQRGSVMNLGLNKETRVKLLRQLDTHTKEGNQLIIRQPV